MSITKPLPIAPRPVTSVRGWLLVPAAVACSLMFALVYLGYRVPTYRSTAVLLIQPQNSLRGNAPAPTPEYIQSQLNILGSAVVLNKVIAELRLNDDAEFTKGVPPQASNALKMEHARDELVRRLDFENDGQSYILRVTARAADPQQAANLANNVASSYASFQQQTKRAQIEGHARALGDLLPRLLEQAQAADAEVERYRRSANVVMVSSVPQDGKIGSNFASATAASMEIIHMAEQRATLARNALDAGERVQAQRGAIARGEGQTTAEVLRSPVVTQLRQMEAEDADNVEDLRKRYKPDHPKLVAAEAELASVRGGLAREITRIHASVQIKQWAASAALRGGDRFNAGLELQRNRDLTAATRMKELQRDATLKRKAYEEAAVESARARELSDVATSDVMVVSPAAPVLQPLELSRAAVLLIAAAVGLVVGFMITLSLNVLKRRKLAN